MKFDPTLVVKSPPTNQGSVLGRIVAGDARLGEILAYLVRWKTALEQSIAETQAELAALRKQRRQRVALFSRTVGNDIESSSGKSVLEICWEMCERVQYFQRRLKVFPTDPEYLHRKETAFGYFLLRVAGIPWGSVGTRRTVDTPGADYLIQSVGDVPLPRVFDPISPEVREAFKSRFLSEQLLLPLPSDRNGIAATHHLKPVTRYAFPETHLSSQQDSLGEDCTDEQIATWYPSIYRGVPNSSSVPNHFYLVTPEPEEKKVVPLPIQPWKDTSRETFLSLFGALNSEALPRIVMGPQSNEEYNPRHKDDESVTVRHLPNWCPTCKQYVSMSHDGPNGIACEDYITEREKKAKQRAVKAAKKSQCAAQTDGAGWGCGTINKNYVGYGPINLKHQENMLIARLDAEKLRKTEALRARIRAEVRAEKRRKSLHLAARQAEMRVRAKVRARGKARRRKTVR